MYSLVGQKRRFSEKGLVISLAAFFFLLPIVLYMPQILNGESIISGDGLLVLFSGDALRESLLEGENSALVSGYSLWRTVCGAE